MVVRGSFATGAGCTGAGGGEVVPRRESDEPPEPPELVVVASVVTSTACVACVERRVGQRLIRGGALAQPHTSASAASQPIASRVVIAGHPATATSSAMAAMSMNPLCRSALDVLSCVTRWSLTVSTASARTPSRAARV